MRDVPNRHRGLPPRTPELLYQIVRKFYRGAVSHFDLIQEKKAEVQQVLTSTAGWPDRERETAIRQALTTLFLEFHFYVTCWLQIEMALYRLAKGNDRHAKIMDNYREVLKTHVTVRHHLDDTEACVEAQRGESSSVWSGATSDLYRFGDLYFTVDQRSLDSLHTLYEAIMAEKET
ncbi:hypothetical protein NDK47_20255 [Brevibacillus ruminantium]|uniref:Uncharacterized protein n=1 Tax=Brevibacillus ruminantium TaxID=2950604 RepID=A0ABY4WBA3_9BACL|nr:hypothetical protein [Brevibacillus ruminantium]USG64460.1 hypothetical protein NDK47_20255 [Brevibacillus ruminantium]